jgi:hypothetical protein
VIPSRGRVAASWILVVGGLPIEKTCNLALCVPCGMNAGFADNRRSHTPERAATLPICSVFAAGASGLEPATSSVKGRLFGCNRHTSATGVPPWPGRCSVNHCDWTILQALCRSRDEPYSRPGGDAEVLRGAEVGNKNSRFTGIFFVSKPSGGLEPPAPSLPWRLEHSAAGRTKAPFPLAFRGSMRCCRPLRGVPSPDSRGPQEPGTCPQDLSPSWCRAWQRQARLHQKSRPRERCFALSERYCPRRSPSYSLRRRRRRAAERHGGGGCHRRRGGGELIQRLSK